ncbi:MAG TPA: phage tail protein [Buttiauxella sp.]
MKSSPDILRTILSGTPGALESITAQTLNKMAGSAARRAVASVAKAQELPVKPVGRRVRLIKATAAKPRAVLLINARDMPAIRSGKPRAVKAGRRGIGGTRAGKKFYPGGFVQNIMYGPQILERTGEKKKVWKNGKQKEVDKLRVIKISLAGPLRTAFLDEVKKSDSAAEISNAIKTKFSWGF